MATKTGAKGAAKPMQQPKANAKAPAKKGTKAPAKKGTKAG